MKKYFFVSACLFIPVLLYAQSPGLIFHNITERQGLSANYSHRLLKDSRGFMWIGTVNGLSRYDGAHFYNFPSGSDSNSFINNEIIDLCEDKAGNIWGATASGIFCYQYKKNRFKNFIPPTLDFARRIQNILCDSRGDIWATSEWNIFKLNKRKNVFEEIGPLTRHKDSLRLYSVRQNGLVEDPSGNGLWFATRSGLHFYNTTGRIFHSFKNRPGDSIFTNHSVAALSLAPGGYVWFFDNVTRKIIAFDPASHKILREVDAEMALPGTYGQTLFEDSHNRLWVSTWNNKMAVIDYRKTSFTPLAYKNDNPLSIAGDHFCDVWEDKDNNIWLATAGGISKCNYSKNVYSIIPIVENVKEFKNCKLGAFTIDPGDKSWWIAAEGNVSVIQYYPESGKYQYYDFSKSVKNRNGQLAGPVFKIGFIDMQPYAMTHTGVWRIDKKTTQVVPFEKQFENWPYIPFDYFVENGDEVWFSTREGHIKWNKRSNRAIKIKAAVDALPDGQRMQYGAAFFDKAGRTWYVPAFGWLAYVNEKNEVVLNYYIKNKAKELAGYLTSITEDSKGNLWMAGLGVGLYKYDIARKEMKLYDQADGISRFIAQAVEDRDGRLWLMAMNKFAVFNPNTNSISNYSLPLYENNRDYGNVLLADTEGAMLATVYKDIIKFLPERLSLKPGVREPILSMIKISGKDQLVTNETKLHLEPDENSLEFNFGSLVSNEIFPYSFEYQLEGFDKEWLTANASAMALYNNLNPGRYIFKVRAVARDRTWQTPERVMTLIIRTPFYKAGWFWLIIVGLLACTLVLFYRFRMNKQKQILTLETKAQELEKEKTMVMYESLKQQLNPHFLFNSLTSLSGLIETDQQVAGNFLEQMSGIYRYILKNGDNETVFLKDELEFVQLYVNLQQTRFKKGLLVNINVPDEYQHYKIAPVTLQNLIENAIKHNVIDAASPLIIDIFISGDYLVVKNNLQRKNVVETSNKKGLAQFTSLYHYLIELPVVIEESQKSFIIKIPLI